MAICACSLLASSRLLSVSRRMLGRLRKYRIRVLQLKRGSSALGFFYLRVNTWQSRDEQVVLKVCSCLDALFLLIGSCLAACLSRFQIARWLRTDDFWDNCPIYVTHFDKRERLVHSMVTPW
jgi:hypothetical protein